VNKPKILVILGPTASGKSDLAVALAKKFNGEIISADSRQVYKGLDIGTGKITKREMRGIPHYLLDVVSPKKQFSVSDYKVCTTRTIVQIVHRGKLPIICGGTGLYIAAALEEINIPDVPPDPVLRKKLEKKSTERLFEMLEELDPERADNIDRNNPRRLVRAIEIANLGVELPSSRPKSPYNVLKIGIKVEEKELKERINKRIQKWFKQGLIKEVENLHDKGLTWKRMAQIGLEYKLVAEFFQNKISREKMIERMQIETYQYAKRQMTWFKKDKEIVWLPPDIKKMEKLVLPFVQNRTRVRTSS
jgi:tRNA dimethylallyltransferase